METFRNILVAMDFSSGADEALRHAHERVASTDGKLAVCHIVPNELRSNLLFPQLSQNAALKIPLELQHAAEALSARVTEVTGRRPDEFELIVDHGTPYAAILAAAENWLADLIVAGSHGMTSAAGVLLGSVTARIIQHAHCPVLIARERRGSGRIVAGTDFSPPALPALKAAAQEVRRTKGTLTIVHSMDYVWSAAALPAMAFGGAPFNISTDELQELQASASEKLKEVFKQLGIEGEAQVAYGAAGQALIDVASALDADLLVVGTVGRTGLRRALLGSVAETVARDAPCSVLIVRSQTD